MIKALSILALISLTGACNTTNRASGSALRSEPSVASGSAKTCSAETAAAETSVRGAFGLTQIAIDWTAEDICAQQAAFPGSVAFAAAVSQSLSSFLEDPSDAESPLAVATLLAFEEMDRPVIEPTPTDVLDRARQILKTYLNRPTAKLSIVAADDTPERGEPVSVNWVIRLKVNDLSDHIFWSVVDRAGARPAYNYGFN